jgi:hypothetical protein
MNKVKIVFLIACFVNSSPEVTFRIALMCTESELKVEKCHWAGSSESQVSGTKHF